MQNDRLLIRTLLVSVALLGLESFAQVPFGGEFRVNAYTPGSQSFASAASDSLGRFVIVWFGQGADDPSNTGIFGQRFDSTGAPLGPEFRVNTYTTQSQMSTAVSAAPNGDFVVVWNSTGQDDAPGNYGVFGQRFSSTGAPLGAEFRVNTYTTGGQFGRSVAMSPSGAFVVVWTGQDQDGASYAVMGQRYASSGTAVGPEFRVNTYTTGSQSNAWVAADTSGSFVVVWADAGQDGSLYGIFGQRYASSGAPVGPEFRVNAYTTGSQIMQSVATDSAGGFVVTWTTPQDQDGSSYGAAGRRFASSGAPVGDDFIANTYTTNTQSAATVASAGAQGAFVVTWRSYPQDGSSSGIFGQVFASSGAKVGAEFRVNSYTTSDQNDPWVGSDPTGNFVVAWESLGEDGASWGVFAQLYCQTLANVSIGVAGQAAVCPTGTGGTATVTDVLGGHGTHAWGYRTSSGGMTTFIPGQTGNTYLVTGAHFNGGALGTYFLVCRTSPQCGATTFSNEVQIQVLADVVSPTVSAPAASTVTQTICQ